MDIEDELSMKLGDIATALDKLGLADALTNMGALELLSKEIKEGSQRIADALLAIADALERETPT